MNRSAKCVGIPSMVKIHSEKRTRTVEQPVVQKAGNGETGVFVEVEITGKATDPEKRTQMTELVDELEAEINAILNE